MASTRPAYIARRPKTSPQVRSARGSSGSKRSQTARKKRKGKERLQYDRNAWTSSSAYVLFNLEDAPTIDIKELVHTVLTKCSEEITDRMQPQNMFNRFLKKKIFPPEFVRDMQELPTTIEKNKTIQEKVYSNTDIYKQFKICLAETGQFPLVETLQICEIQTHDQLKSTGFFCECKNTEHCSRLLGIRCSLSKYIHISIALPQEVNPVLQLQSNLINIYEYFCQHHPVYPLKPDETIPLESLYVLPDMATADLFEKRTWKNRLCDAVEEPRLRGIQPPQLQSYREIFYNNESPCRNIYIVGEAGIGKSSLCGRFINTWCKAHGTRQQNADAELSDDEEMMAEFSLLFYISLSAASEDSNVEDMIGRQQLTTVDVSEFLENEKCLVILDGLDEWKPRDYKGSPFITEGLPIRKMNMKNTTVVTTARPWKIETLKLKEQEIDKLIHITGLGTKAIESLVENVMESLADKGNTKQTKAPNKLVGEFTKQLTDAELKLFKKVPVLLMQVLSLWYDGLPFGKSQCEIYANIISRQLRSVNLPKEPSQEEDEDYISQDEIVLPGCLSRTNHCQQDIRLLLSLSRLAYYTLTSVKRESLLVSEEAAVHDHDINIEELQFCYRTGLLNQNMYFGTKSESMKLITFAQKKHHEYFAALYIAAFAEQRETEHLLNLLSTFEMVVDMEKLLLFVCGMNPALGSELSKVIIDTISKEEEVPIFRYSCRDPEVEPAYPLIRKHQEIIFDCATEAGKNDHIDATFYIGDLVLVRDTFANINGHLRALNPEHLLSASITIDSDVYIGKKQELRAIVDRVWQSKCLQKFYLDDRRNIIEAERIFTTVSATSSTLCCLVLANVNLTELGDKLTSLLYSPQLISVGLDTVSLTETQIGLLAKFVEETRQLQELRLCTLLCDGSNAMGYKLDLSDQRRIRKLFLRDLYVEEIYIDAGKLTHCEIGYLHIPGTTRAILSYLREETKLQVFECSGCPDNMDAFAVVDSLKAFIGLKEVVLQNTDFKNGVPRLSTATEHLKSVRFANVTITEKALKRVFDCFHQDGLCVSLDKVSVVCDPDSEDGEITEFLKEKHPNVNVTWFRCRFQDRDNSWKLLTQR